MSFSAVKFHCHMERPPLQIRSVSAQNTHCLIPGPVWAESYNMSGWSESTLAVSGPCAETITKAAQTSALLHSHTLDNFFSLFLLSEKFIFRLPQQWVTRCEGRWVCTSRNGICDQDVQLVCTPPLPMSVVSAVFRVPSLSVPQLLFSGTFLPRP